MSDATVIKRIVCGKPFYIIAEHATPNHWFTWAGIYESKESAIEKIKNTKGVQYVENSNVKKES